MKIEKSIVDYWKLFGTLKVVWVHHHGYICQFKLIHDILLGFSNDLKCFLIFMLVEFYDITLFSYNSRNADI